MAALYQAGRLGTGNIAINLAGNDQDWNRSVTAYLSLPKIEKAESETVINLELYLCSMREMDEIIPLPGADCLVREKTLLVDRPVSSSTYSLERNRWVDYEGFGRFLLNYDENRAVAGLHKDSGISQVYADIALGYNPLLGLLAGHGYNSIHASCARVGGKGILFTGYGGSGKSTSAYALLRRGHQVLADDRILLKKERAGENGRERIANDQYTAYSISDVMKLKQEAIDSFFPEAKEIKYLHRVDDEFYFKATTCDAGAYLNSTEIDYLMIFEKTGLPETTLERINPSRVVGDLFPVTMSNYEAAAMEKKFSFLTGFLESVQCYKVYFGTDMDGFVRCVEKLVQD